MQTFEALFVVYFIYGLAFFSLGLILLIESMRAPSEIKIPYLLFLAVFGILHGMHEWLEIFILQSEHLGGVLPDWVEWFRVVFLGVSFIGLWGYGLQTFQPARKRFGPITTFGLISLPIYLLLIIADVLFAAHNGQISTLEVVSALNRYVLAVPGAAIAALGLFAGAAKEMEHGKKKPGRYWLWGAIGFSIYSITQLVINPIDTIAASYLNSSIFLHFMGFPIQVLRTLAAVIITLNLFLNTQFLEKERQEQLDSAQKSRLDALEQKEALQRELFRSTIRAQEEERARISRELHDEMAQTLTAFSLGLGTLQQNLPKKAATQKNVQDLQTLSKQMSQDMYRLVHDLRPAFLDDLGLVPALRSLIENKHFTPALSGTLTVEGSATRLDSLVETTLFRIVQEALTNIVRHAKAGQAHLFLEFKKNEVVLRVTDSGIGFEPTQISSRSNSLGLAGMRERVESIGGALNVESATGKGTQITVSVPLNALTKAG